MFHYWDTRTTIAVTLSSPLCWFASSISLSTLSSGVYCSTIERISASLTRFIETIGAENEDIALLDWLLKQVHFHIGMYPNSSV